MKLNVQQQPIVIVHCSTKQEWLKHKPGCYLLLCEGAGKSLLTSICSKVNLSSFSQDQKSVCKMLWSGAYRVFPKLVCLWITPLLNRQSLL